MDMSKLPKLSQTPPSAANVESTHPPGENPPRSIEYERRGPEPVSIAEIWISIFVGLILLVMYPTMMKYISSRLFGTTFDPILLTDGSTVPYPKFYPWFWSDLSITAFAFVLLFEGIALAMMRKRWLVMLAFGLTVVATLLNLGYVIATVTTYGPPTVSLLAVAFGGYIAIYQWRLLRSLSVRA